MLQNVTELMDKHVTKNTILVQKRISVFSPYKILDILQLHRLQGREGEGQSAREPAKQGLA